MLCRSCPLFEAWTDAEVAVDALVAEHPGLVVAGVCHAPRKRTATVESCLVDRRGCQKSDEALARTWRRGAARPSWRARWRTWPPQQRAAQ